MKKYCAMILTLLLSIAAFVGCAAKAPASTPTAAPTAAQTSAPAPAPTQTLARAQDQAAAPKYVFLFIGDGMSRQREYLRFKLFLPGFRIHGHFNCNGV